MSDDLIKQWDEYVESMGSVMGEVEHMAQKMRDRIEQLKRDQKQGGEDYRALMEKHDALHVKLAKAVEALTVVVPTEAQICSACLSYDHSFGLMDGPQRVAMMHEAREWLHAWRKEDRAVQAKLEKPNDIQNCLLYTSPSPRDS